MYAVRTYSIKFFSLDKNLRTYEFGTVSSRRIAVFCLLLSSPLSPPFFQTRFRYMPKDNYHRSRIFSFDVFFFFARPSRANREFDFMLFFFFALPPSSRFFFFLFIKRCKTLTTCSYVRRICCNFLEVTRIGQKQRFHTQMLTRKGIL